MSHQTYPEKVKEMLANGQDFEEDPYTVLKRALFYIGEKTPESIGQRMEMFFKLTKGKYMVDPTQALTLARTDMEYKLLIGRGATLTYA